jgi:hypothetical protein
MGAISTAAAAAAAQVWELYLMLHTTVAEQRQRTRYTGTRGMQQQHHNAAGREARQARHPAPSCKAANAIKAGTSYPTALVAAMLNSKEQQLVCLLSLASCWRLAGVLIALLSLTGVCVRQVYELVTYGVDVAGTAGNRSYESRPYLATWCEPLVRCMLLQLAATQAARQTCRRGAERLAFLPVYHASRSCARPAVTHIVLLLLWRAAAAAAQRRLLAATGALVITLLQHDPSVAYLPERRALLMQGKG